MRRSRTTSFTRTTAALNDLEYTEIASRERRRKQNQLQHPAQSFTGHERNEFCSPATFLFYKGHVLKTALHFRASLTGLLLLGLHLPLLFAQQAASSQSFDLLSAAKASLDAGHYADAGKTLREYIAAHPSDPEAQYLLGYSLFREDKPADSLNQYTAAAKLRPPQESDLKTVALDYVLLNDYSDAEHWIHYAISLDASDAEGWYEMGRIEYTLNHFQQAVDAFQKSLQLDPASVKAENNLGLAYEGLNQNDQALASYRKAVAMQAASSHPSEQPLLNLATLLVERAQLDEALPLLQQADRIAPHNWKILAELGRLFTEKGELPAALAALTQAVSLEPQRGSLHFQLGQAYKKSGDTEKAQAEFAIAQKLLSTTSSPPR
jgi:Flp pilus assembly protein TadD